MGASGVVSTFPQRNGDVFSFTPELNRVFMHGVPRPGYGSPCLQPEGQGARLSLILWGARVLEEEEEEVAVPPAEGADAPPAGPVCAEPAPGGAAVPVGPAEHPTASASVAAD
eukprot:NODE_1255_length_1191_cov_586.840669.p6 GENE.NODE_1255_length_1191_cov_586.840669~~NODE_1255_length_1191_cov_586.840669.p6  ORF type:complete len:113 (-),score=25.37 NODE_1255_length_1191_cov_586.840669:835-1173(-)